MAQGPQRGRRSSRSSGGGARTVPTHDGPDYSEKPNPISEQPKGFRPPRPTSELLTHVTLNWDKRIEKKVRSNVSNAPSAFLYGATFIVVVFGLTFLVVGAIHTEDCNIEPMIPIWLIVLGVILCALAIWGTVLMVRIKKSPFRKVSGLEKIITGIMFLIFLAWFIAGNVWVYTAYADNPDYGHLWFDNACDKATFNLAFAAAIALDVMVGLALVGLCIWGVSQFVVRE